MKSNAAEILWKVKLHMDNQKVHTVMVRGLNEGHVISKLTPAIPAVVIVQTTEYEVFAVHSQKISAIEFIKEE